MKIIWGKDMTWDDLNESCEGFRESFIDAVSNTNEMYSSEGVSKAVHFHENCDGPEVVTFIDLSGPETNCQSYVIDEIEEIEDMYLKHYKEELKEDELCDLIIPEEVFKKYCQ